MVGILDAAVFAEVYQSQQRLVGLGGAGENEVVHHQVIGGTVADQQVTVAVQNIAPGRLNTGHGGKGGGIVNDTAGFDDLLVVQLEREEAEDYAHQQNQQCGAKTGHSFHV